MPPRVIALGELLVEVMRTGVDQPLSEPGEFVGPFPSGAPAISPSVGRFSNAKRPPTGSIDSR